jgi:hypothetical protein
MREKSLEQALRTVKRAQVVESNMAAREIQAKKAELIAKDAMLAPKEEELVELHSVLKAKDKDLKVKDAEVYYLRTEVDAKDSEIKEQAAEFDGSRNRLLSDLNDLRSVLNAKDEELKAKYAEVYHLLTEVDAKDL